MNRLVAVYVRSFRSSSTPTRTMVVFFDYITKNTYFNVEVPGTLGEAFKNHAFMFFFQPNVELLDQTHFSHANRLPLTYKPNPNDSIVCVNMKKILMQYYNLAKTHTHTQAPNYTLQLLWQHASTCTRDNCMSKGCFFLRFFLRHTNHCSSISCVMNGPCRLVEELRNF